MVSVNVKNKGLYDKLVLSFKWSYLIRVKIKTCRYTQGTKNKKEERNGTNETENTYWS